jgi:protein-tyrosine phosphatase
VPFVDLHSHVLPALDDGSKSMTESLEMMSLLGKVGFDTVVATPHQRHGMFMPSRASIDGAHERLRSSLPPGSPTLLLGAENMWDEVFLERSLSSAQPGYTGGRAFLFELPVHTMPPRLEEKLFAIHRAPGNLLPVMAHPERYEALWGDVDRVARLRTQAALVIDLGALDGAHGRAQCKAARAWVEEGLVHAAASDVHGPSDVRFAAAGIAWIRKRLGETEVQRLLSDGPRRILNGEIPD